MVMGGRVGVSVFVVILIVFFEMLRMNMVMVKIVNDIRI